MEGVLLREIQGNNNNQLLEEFIVVSVGVVISNNDKVAPASPGGHFIQDRIRVLDNRLNVYEMTFKIGSRRIQMVSSYN